MRKTEKISVLLAFTVALVMFSNLEGDGDDGSSVWSKRCSDLKSIFFSDSVTSLVTYFCPGRLGNILCIYGHLSMLKRTYNVEVRLK